MPLLAPPAELTLADLEDLAGLDPGPEYVLAFTPPRFYPNVRDRLTQPGFWELLTVSDYESGNPASEDRVWEAPRNTPEADLTAWVGLLLGYPVALKRDKVELPGDGALAPSHPEPLYWVLRDS